MNRFNFGQSQGKGRRMNIEAPAEEPRGGGSAISIYLVAFVTGAIVMSFEMLGSRYLAPSFGAGIYTWASLISTVLAALCAGYFLGGYVADRYPSPKLLGATVAVASVYLLLLPAFSEQVLQFFAWQIDDIKLGSLAAAMAIMLFPVTFLGMYSPFAIRLLMRSKQNAGAVSGTVYGISTAGSILGTLATTLGHASAPVHASQVCRICRCTSLLTISRLIRNLSLAATRRCRPSGGREADSLLPSTIPSLLRR